MWLFIFNCMIILSISSAGGVGGGGVWIDGV